MYKIMIIEDDNIISDSIKKGLESWGFETFQVTDFKSAIVEFHRFAPHLVLVDISLPFFNGYHWCAEIRKVSNVPIMFISSASENMNIIMAMNMGGDDYLIKPFEIGLLEAKVHALLRRAYDFSMSSEILECNGLTLNIGDMTASFNGKCHDLTKNEFKILESLMKAKGAVVSRDDLMNALWQSDLFIDDNSLSVNVARLRKSLGDMGVADFIQTKKGVGYYVKCQ